MRSLTAIATAAIVVSGAMLVDSDAADAAAWGYYNKVISKSSAANYTGSQILASCGSRTTSIDCSLTKAAAATRTIDVAFNATRAWTAGQLRISASKTQSVSVTCSKRNVPKGKMLIARPVGTRYRYKIQRHMTGGGRDYVSGTSGWRYAFNPGSARVTCDIVAYR